MDVIVRSTEYATPEIRGAAVRIVAKPAVDYTPVDRYACAVCRLSFATRTRIQRSGSHCGAKH